MGKKKLARPDRDSSLSFSLSSGTTASPSGGRALRERPGEMEGDDVAEGVHGGVADRVEVTEMAAKEGLWSADTAEGDGPAAEGSHQDAAMTSRTARIEGGGLVAEEGSASQPPAWLQSQARAWLAPLGLGYMDLSIKVRFPPLSSQWNISSSLYSVQ